LLLVQDDLQAATRAHLQQSLASRLGQMLIGDGNKPPANIKEYHSLQCF